MQQLNLYIPTQKSALTSKQLRFISRLLLNKRTTTDFLLKAFLFLSGLKLVINKPAEPTGERWYQHKSRKKPILMNTETLAHMANQCNFLLQPGEVQPIRWIRFARARHFRLHNACFEEYLMAENYMMAYIETKRPEHLHNLMAVLYRRPWHRWNANKIQQRGKQFRNADPALKNSVFLWYYGFRSYVPKRCPTLFNSSEKSNRPFTIRNYINGMIHQLTNGDITLKDKLLQRPVWDALDEMEQRALDAEMIKKK